MHEPIFVYRVVVGEIVATGKGPSKKKAKHNAAQEALEKIREVVASAAGQDMSQVSWPLSNENDSFLEIDTKVL